MLYVLRIKTLYVALLAIMVVITIIVIPILLHPQKQQLAGRQEETPIQTPSNKAAEVLRELSSNTLLKYIPSQFISNYLSKGYSVRLIVMNNSRVNEIVPYATSSAFSPEFLRYCSIGLSIGLIGSDNMFIEIGQCRIDDFTNYISTYTMVNASVSDRDGYTVYVRESHGWVRVYIVNRQTSIAGSIVGVFDKDQGIDLLIELANGLRNGYNDPSLLSPAADLVKQVPIGYMRNRILVSMGDGYSIMVFMGKTSTGKQDSVKSYLVVNSDLSVLYKDLEDFIIVNETSNYVLYKIVSERSCFGEPIVITDATLSIIHSVEFSMVQLEIVLANRCNLAVNVTDFLVDNSGVKGMGVGYAYLYPRTVYGGSGVVVVVGNASITDPELMMEWESGTRHIVIIYYRIVDKPWRMFSYVYTVCV